MPKENKIINVISVIIPTYNRAHIIRETLDSLIAQKYQLWECIVVDDRSLDVTIELLKFYAEKDKRFKFYERPLNNKKGPNSCRNHGYKYALGEYILFLDSDDVLKSNALELININFNIDFDALVYPVEIKNFTTNFILKKSNVIPRKDLIQEYFTGKVAYFVCGVVWKNQFLKNAENLFDENITNLDDWDFNMRMLYRRPKLQYLENALIYYRKHNDSLSQEINNLNIQEIKSEISARDKHLKLIKENKSTPLNPLLKYVIIRLKHIYRNTLINNNRHRYFILGQLLQKQLNIRDFRGVYFTIMATISFILFNKGERFLK